MKKSVKRVLVALAVIACSVLALRASGLILQSGSWSQTGNLSSARVGASAAMLPDGRILVTGGDPGTGPLATADFFGTDGTISAAPPMVNARSQHISVALQDGRVLVTGGLTAGGSATNGAEIYDPVANSWTSVGAGMIEARSGATAAVLQDGRVAIAGGKNGTVISSTMEVFDPAVGTFAYVGMMSSPRSQHAMAELQDGRVLIVGGNSGNTGTPPAPTPVASTDIYDPVAGTVTAGPVLNTARYNHSATTLLNGQVVVIGGNNGNANPAQMDVTPAEVIDFTAATPAFTTLAANLATPREGHLAFLLPNNNNVLIVGGTSAGTTIAAAELFTAQGAAPSVWAYSFGSTGTMTAARSSAAGSANQVNATSTIMQRNGVLMVAGGADANGNSLISTEAYGYATVQTDATEYAPGSPVTITGSGWVPGEIVTLSLLESPYFDTHPTLTAVADANGNISNSQFSPDLHDIGISFFLAATGSVSQAQNTFADSKPNTVTLSPTSVTVAPTTSAQYTVTVDFSGNGNTCTSPLSIQTPPSLPTGATASFNPTSVTSTNTNLTSTLTITTTNATPPGSTTFNVLAGNGTGCQVGTATGTGTLVVVENTTTTLASSVNPSTFGQSTTLTATVAQVTGPTTPNAGTVTFKDGANTLGTGTLNASGVATLAVSTLTAGAHSLTASYAGTALFGASTSTNTVSQVVNQASTTTSVASSQNPSVFAQSVTFTATVTDSSTGSTGTPTGTVTFKDGTTTLGTGTLNGSGVATISTSSLSVASHSITAAYGGDTNFTTSASNTLTQTVNQANTTTALTSSANPSVFGQSVTFTATVTVNSPGAGTILAGETVTFKDAGTAIGTGTTNASGVATFASSALAVATHSITAVYAGDTNFATSTSTALSQTVNRANTTTTVTSSANPSVFGQSVTFTATVTVNSPGAGTIPASETVTFKDGGTAIGTGTTNASGVATFTTSTLAVATHSITAVYAGDTNFATSTSSAVTQVVNKASTTTTITNDLSAATVVGQAYSVAVSVTINAPGAGTIPNGDTVTVSDGSASCTVTLSSAAGSCSLTSTTAGNKTITATYNGDANLNTSTSAGVAHAVNKANTTATITSNTPNPSTVGQTITVNYTVTVNSPGAGTPTGTVTVSDGVAGDICNGTVAAGTCQITIGTAGTKTLTATYVGDTNFNTSASTGTSQTVNPKLAFTSAAFAIITGTCSSTISVQIQNGNGSQATVTTATVLNLSSNSGTGKFFSNSTCTTQITTATIAAGSSSASFFYEDTTVGSPVITVASTGLTSVTQTEAITGVRFGTAAFSVQVNSCSSAISLQSANAQAGNPASLTQATTINLSSSSANGKFYSNATCTSTSQITSTTISPNIDNGHDSLPFYYEDTTVGSPTLTASAGTASATQTETVSKANTTTTVASSGTPTVFGQSVTFTATVTVNSPGTGTPTGTVTFYDGGTSMGTGALNQASPDQATLSTSTLSVGNHTITAAYTSGDSSFNASAMSSSITQVVNQAATSTTLTSSLNPSFFGLQVTFTATVSSSSGRPTGTVNFFDGANQIGTGTLSLIGADDVATFSTSSLTVGTHTITAQYVSDGNFSGSTSNAVSQQVINAATTTTVTSSANPSVYGQGISFTATVTPQQSGQGPVTGMVQFSIDGSPFGNPVTLSNGSATIGPISNLSVGAAGHLVTATYSPATGSVYQSSTSATLTQIVNQDGTATLIMSSPNPSTFGQTVMITVTVAASAPGSGTPTGTVSFMIDNTPATVLTLVGGSATTSTSSLSVGSHTFTANYSGDGNFTASMASAAQMVNQATTSTALTVNPGSINFGESTTVTATVSPQNGGTPTGTVTVSDGIGNATGDSCTITLSGGTTCMLTPSATAPGGSTVTGTYSGDTNFQGSMGTASLIVNAATTTTTLASTPTSSTLGQGVAFTATVMDTSSGDTAVPNGTVNFFDGGTTLIGSATLNASGNATFTTALLSSSASPHSITANFIGNADFSASMTSSPVSQVVGPRSTTTALSVNPTTVVVGQFSTVMATVSDVTTFGPSGTPGAFALTTKNLNTPRTGHASALLPNGTVLIAGGEDTSGVLNSAEIYDPVAGTFTTLSVTLTTPRTSATATLLNNGTVLIAGGSSDGTTALASAEIFDPVAGKFTPLTASLSSPRFGHTATLLPNGTVLIAGGQGGSGTTMEVFDPSGPSFTAINDTLSVARAGHTATLLFNGRILFAGGSGLASAEIYDSNAHTSTPLTSSLTTDRTNHAAVLLPDGNVLIAGGTSSSNFGNAVNTTELYNTAAKSFTASGNTNAARSGLTATMLDSAQVLIVGGSNSTYAALASAELYTPSFDPLGTVTVTSSDGADGITGSPCALTLSGTGATTCTVTDTPIDVGTSPHTISGTYTPASDSVHTGSQGSASLKVNPADTTTTVTTNPTASYGDANVTLSASVAANSPSTAIVNEGTVTFTVMQGSNTIGTVTSGTVTGGAATASFPLNHVNAGSYTVAATYNPAASNPNFNTSSAATPGTLTVNKRSITVTAVTNTKVFDGTTSAAATPMITSGSLAGSDTANFTEVYSTKNAGTGLTLTPSGTVMNGANDETANYAITFVSSNTGVIQGLPITATLMAANKTYNGMNTEPDANMSCTLSGVLPADSANVSCTATSGTFNSAQVATATTVTATVTISGTAAGNYTLGAAGTSTNSTSAAATAHITTAAVAATLTAANKTYDGTTTETSSMNCSVAPVVTGDLVTCTATSGTFNSSQVATATTVTATVTISGASASNYSLGAAGTTLSSTTAMAPASITPATPLVTVSGGPFTYDGYPHPATVVAIGVNSSAVSGNFAVAYTLAGNAANPVNAGTYMVSASFTSTDANYTGAVGVGSIIINQATTSTSVSSSPNPSNWGNVVTLTATVTNTSTPAVPTGSVSFYNAATGASCSSLGSSTLLDTDSLVTVMVGSSSSQQASTSTPNLPVGPGNTVGTDTILACYNYFDVADLRFNPNFTTSYGTTSQMVNPAPIVTLAPASLSFGGQAGGTTSGAQTVTVCNGPSGVSGSPCYNAPISTAALLITGIGFTNSNTNPVYFTQTSTCPNGGIGLAVGGSCPINVKFAPPLNTQGIATALLTVTDNNENVTGSTQSASLVGAGTSVVPGVGSLSTYAIFATANGCSSVNVSGNGTVDSFDGPSNSGNIGTNGNATLSGNPVVNGAVYSPIAGTGNCTSKTMTGLSTSGKAQATGGLQALSGPVTYPLPPAANPAPPTTNQNITSCPSGMTGCMNTGNKTVTLAPGLYGNVAITGGTTVNVSGGTYNINSLTLSGNSTLVVTPSTTPVVVNLAGKSLTGGNTALDLSGGSMSNSSGMASNLQFYYAGSQPVKLSGGTGSYAVVYAPNAPINVSGGSQFSGAVVGNTINSSGNTAIHYDAGLPSISTGDYIWFNSGALNVQGLPTSGSVKLYVTNASINFMANGTTYNLPVPNAVITFSSTATTASTTWDATNNRWSTIVPTSSVNNVTSIHTFLDGIAFQVPSNFSTGVQNVTWQAAYSTSTPGFKFNWQWGAAVYSSLPAAGATGNYSSFGVNALDSAVPAGTPVNYEANLVFGDTGAGYTGLYANSVGVVPTIAPMNVAPSSYDFGSVSQGTPVTSTPITLTNNDTVSYTINNIQMTGTYASDFMILQSGVINNCFGASSLASGASCNLVVTFKPLSASGIKETAKIVINDNANNSPQTVFLKGTVQ